jgi:hypothetical protein
VADDACGVVSILRTICVVNLIVDLGVTLFNEGNIFVNATFPDMTFTSEKR